MDTIQNDEKAIRILTRAIRIKVSQYAFETLMALTERYHYKSVENLFFNTSIKSSRQMIPQLEVIEDKKEYEELFKGSSLHTGLTEKQKQEVNNSDYFYGVTKEKWLMKRGLDLAYEKKLNNSEILNIDGS